MMDIPLSLTRILEYGASVHGDTTVTTWHGEGTGSEFDPAEEVTFRDIAARAAAFAHAIHDELGITSDERVGSFMWNCAEHLEVMFGTACKGAIFAPLNKQLMNDQIRHIINHAEISAIVCDPRLAQQLGKVLVGTDSVGSVIITGAQPAQQFAHLFPRGVEVYSYEALIDGRSTVYDWPELDERTAAALCYSTGTTGAPKGVLYSHRSLYLEAMQLRSSDSLCITHGETFLCCIPICHVLSWGVPFTCFMTGTPLVLPDADVSAPTLAKAIAATSPRVAHGVPTIWIQLFVHYMHHPPERMTLTEIYAGGSPVPPTLIKMWEERYGVDVVHVWGMVETSTVGSVARPPQGASGDTRWAYRVSQGRIPASLEYRVVNDGQVVARTDRNAGELQVRGPQVMRGYLGNPGATRNAIVDGWLRTGDIARVNPDATVTVVDRAKDVFKYHGFQIAPAELEALMLTHPQIDDVAVAERGGVPKAFVVKQGPLDEAQVMEWVAASVTAYKKVRAVAFVDAIPRNAAGKILRNNL